MNSEIPKIQIVNESLEPLSLPDPEEIVIIDKFEDIRKGDLVIPSGKEEQPVHDLLPSLEPEQKEQEKSDDSKSEEKPGDTAKEEQKQNLGEGVEDLDFPELPDYPQEKGPVQEIRGVLELKPPDEDDAPFLTLTYDFSKIPDSFQLSKNYHTLEYVYYKYKPLLIKAQEFARRKMIKNALNYYRMIKSQNIPPEFKRMINRNIQDITDYKRLEKQLFHAHKMEAVGQLAGGISHDFNNILTAIIGYASMILEDLKKDDPTAVRVGYILTAAERGANLVQNLLTFSRKQIANPKPINLNEIIMGFQNLLERLIKENIELRVFYPEDELIIMADSGQIGQVLMNLTTNARDAMPEGGVLTIKTERFFMDENFLKKHGFGEIGEYALFVVSDTGIGMDKETKERIFEPFFTTKEDGKGTGLGMAIVYSIIRQHHGYIDLYSEPNGGTVFKIYLSLLKENLKGRTELTHIEELRGGSETILLAEDDTEVRRLISEILRGNGYNVIEAFDGEEAIKRFLERKDEVELVLLDLIMPVRNGRGVFEVIKEIKRGVKVLFMSGYTFYLLKDELIRDNCFISKPVSPPELLNRLRELLD